VDIFYHQGWGIIGLRILIYWRKTSGEKTSEEKTAGDKIAGDKTAGD
jgi:hypothetical protein